MPSSPISVMIERSNVSWRAAISTRGCRRCLAVVVRRVAHGALFVVELVVEAKRVIPLEGCFHVSVPVFGSRSMISVRMCGPARPAC